MESGPRPQLSEIGAVVEILEARLLDERQRLRSREEPEPFSRERGPDRGVREGADRLDPQVDDGPARPGEPFDDLVAHEEGGGDENLFFERMRGADVGELLDEAG